MPASERLRPQLCVCNTAVSLRRSTMRYGVIVAMVLFVATSRALTQKSECLLHYINGRHGEYEDDDREDRQLGRVGPPGGAAGAAYHGEYHRSSEEAEDEGHRYLLPGHSLGAHRSGWNSGHNPGRGYLDEEGEWEDARKRRKRGDGEQEYNTPHIQDTLAGRLSCAADSVIHILNVTVGYSNTQQCYQALPGCQAGSSVAKQVINCQGNMGVCDVTFGRHFMIRCGHQTNFALVNYECIPATTRVDICGSTNSDVTDALILTSTNYPGRSNSLTTGTSNIVACECTLRALANSHIEMEYLRTHLPISGSACSGDMLILERPDPMGEGRYLMEREICGHNVSNHVIIADYILRVTFLTGAPLIEGKSGFIAKFKALSAVGTAETLHVSCAGTHQGAVPDTQARLVSNSSQPSARNLSTPAVNQSAQADRLREWMKTNGRTLPPNLDPSNLPANFFNLSREELQSRLLQTRAQSQKIVGAQNEDPQTMQASEDTVLPSSSSGGVLSGVVASLASVVLILGSVGALIFYRRHQKKGHQEKQHQQLTPALSHTGAWVKDGFIHNNTGAGTGGVHSTPSNKNQDRPLPKPATDTRGSIDSSGKRSLNCDGPESRTTDDVDQADPKATTINSLYKNGCLSSNIYSIAVTVPDATDGSHVADIDFHKTLRQTPGETKPPASQNALENCRSTSVPMAPPRTKRHELQRFAEVSADYMSPYDNAATNSISAKDEAVSADGGKKATTTAKPTIFAYNKREATNHRRTEAEIDEKEDETYSSIYEMQMEGNLSPDQDNTEV